VARAEGSYSTSPRDAIHTLPLQPSLIIEPQQQQRSTPPTLRGPVHFAFTVVPPLAALLLARATLSLHTQQRRGLRQGKAKANKAREKRQADRRWFVDFPVLLDRSFLGRT
jgi:hypothetical protein